MANNQRSYPFPVLGNGDDIKGEFVPDFECALDPRTITLNLKLVLQNKTLENLINQNLASFVVEVQCAGTFFRKTFQSNKKSWSEDVPASDLRDKVDLRFYICANKFIANYRPEGLHPDLVVEGFNIHIEKGDILADGGSGSFIADKEFHPLKSPISSFVKIRCNNKNNAPVEVSYDDDNIIIYLSKNDYKLYNQTKEDAPSIMHCSIVLPVITSALYMMSESNKYGNTPWRDRIEQICKERGYDPDDHLITAQRMLGFPVNRCLDWLNKTRREDNE